MPKYGIGTGSTEVFSGQPWYFSHPGKLRAGAVINPATGEYDDDQYEIAPGMLPSTMQRFLAAYSTPRAPYTGPGRIAPLTNMQKLAHEMLAGDFARSKKWAADSLSDTNRNLMNKVALSRSSEVSDPYLTRSVERITPEDRGSWVNAVKSGVIRPMQEEMHEDLMKRTLPAIDAQLIATGNFRSPRRKERYMQAIQDMNKVIGRESNRALFEGLKLGEEGAQREKGRLMHAAEVSGGLRSNDLSRIIDAAKASEHITGEQQRRNILDAGSIEAAGKVEQDHEQMARNIAYADFERQEAAKREDAAAMIAGVKGHTLPTHTQAMYPPTEAGPSIMRQLAGAGLGLWGMSMGANSVNRGGGHYKGGSVRSTYNTGGRVKKLGGGSIMDRISQSMDPLNRVRDQMLSNAGVQTPPQQNPIPSFIDQDTSDVPDMHEDPLASGAATATRSHAAMKMEHHRRKMEEYSERLQNSDAMNPMGSFLAKTGFKLMGSKNPNLGGALGESMEAGLDDYQNAILANQKQQERAMKINEALQETYRIEETDRLKREAQAEQDAALQNYKLKAYDEQKRHNQEMEKIARIRAGASKSGKTSSTTVESTDSMISSPEELFKLSKEEKNNYSKELPSLMEQKDRIVSAKKALETAGPMGPGLDGKWGTILTVLDPTAKLKDRQTFTAKTMDILLNSENSSKGVIGKQKHEDFKTSKAGPDKLKEVSRELLNEKEKEVDNRSAIIQFKSAAEGKLPGRVVIQAVMDWNADGGRGQIANYVPDEWKPSIGILPDEKKRVTAALSQVSDDELLKIANGA